MLCTRVPAFWRLIRSHEVTMLLKELAEAYPGALLRGDGGAVITGLAYDSRTAGAGDLFLAVPGTFRDGTDYIAEAVERGAAAVVAERDAAPLEGTPLIIVDDVRRAKSAMAAHFFGRPSRRLRCAGVTGTNGKTTVAYMTRAILEQNGLSTGLLGTIRNLVGREELRARTTTPDAVDIQRYLARMVDENQDAAVLEVSSHALVQSRARDVEFRVGIFTNLSREHLDYHRSMEEYRDAKALLFASLDPGAAAVLNGDDPSWRHMAAACRCPVIRYGLGGDAEVSGSIRRQDLDGFSMIMKTPAGEIDVTSRLLGRHNIMNALAAASAALALDVPLPAVKAGLEALSSVPGRVEPVDAGQDFRVIVDYAHTDDALHKLLENLRPLAKRRLITVFGCGGDRDVFKRPLMGKAATTYSDLTIVTSDNPRSENAGKIINDILPGCVAGAAIRVEPDRRAAIEMALREARGGDIVAIAGKGHEDYQILNDGVVDFDDRQVAADILWTLV